MSELHLITTVADGGLGKSTDLIRAFAQGRHVAPPGALGMARTLLGIDLPWVKEARTLQEARKALRAYMAENAPGGYGVSIDELSLLCRNTAREAEAKFPKEGSGVYDFFNYMTAQVEATEKTLKEAMAFFGCHGMVTCHRREPDTKCKGGPSLDGASWKCTPYWFKQSGVVLVGMRDDKRPTAWKGYYWHDPGHAQWMMKDRTNICGRKAPMSMGEILRAYGDDIPRPMGFEWMEEWVEAVAGWIAEAGGEAPALPKIAAELGRQLNGVDPLHAKWIKWDAYARWEIRKHLEEMRGAW